MEVEIKLRLPDAEAHAAVARALGGRPRAVHEQENFFFADDQGKLAGARLVLRVRFYNHDRRAIITLKGRQALKDGVGRATEQEEDVDPVAARGFLERPDELLQLDSPIMRSLREQQELGHLTCLGGFRNHREEFDWEGLVLELDRTMYDWGTVYEIEVETPEPDEAKPKLEALLKQHSIPYKYNTTTKFANFRNKTLV